jgi:hypothetical protein
MVSTVIGGAMLPHAPQFFTMPETEDKANVEPGARLGQPAPRKARGRQAEIPDRLRRGRAGRHRQYRAAVLGLRRRRARRTQTGHRVDGPELDHNYASLGWTGAGLGRHDAHYPAIRPDLVELTAALHGLAHEQDKRERYVRDAAGYAKGFKLTEEQERALLELDLEKIVAMGAHPLVPFLARMQIQRMRKE